MRADGWIDGVMTRSERVSEKKDWWMGKQMDSGTCHSCLWFEAGRCLQSSQPKSMFSPSPSALKPYRCGEWEEGPG